MLIAIPLGFVNPRRGRGLSLSIAVLLAVTYFNTIGILQGAVIREKVSFWAALWPIHLSVFFLSILFLLWRDNTSSRTHPARLLGAARHWFVGLRNSVS
jgi:lipopolysaccharide export system permease protein